jgi:hypothetical protein
MDWVYMTPGQDHVTGSCELGVKNEGSIKDGEFFDQLSACQLVKKNFVF